MKRQDRMAARARVWLPAQLEEGPQQTRKLFERAEAAGISRHALCRIQQELGVQTARRGAAVNGGGMERLMHIYSL